MTAGRYASETSVTVERSRAMLETLLRRYGADQLVTGWETGRAMVAFRIAGRPIRLEIPMPTRADAARTPTGKQRHSADIPNALEQMERQRWRAILLLVQSKLEAVEIGVETLDQAFLSNMVMADGQTVGQKLGADIERYLRDGGSLPPLLPAGGST